MGNRNRKVPRQSFRQKRAENQAAKRRAETARRDLVLTRVAEGLPISGDDERYVLDELMAIDRADPAEWEEMSVPQRRTWLEEEGNRIRAGAVPLDQVAYGRDALQPSPAAVQVVTYRSAKDYERDAQRRVADGWTIQGQSQETGQTHRIRRATSGAIIGGLFMMPLAGAAVGGLSNKRTPGRITVTWVKAASVSDAQATVPPATDDSDSSEALVRHLKSLADLRDSGVLTEDEFQAKKAELLSKI